MVRARPGLHTCTFHVTRQAAEMLNIDSLPTSDLLSIVEERLLQCMQKQSDTAALRVHEEGEGPLQPFRI